MCTRTEDRDVFVARSRHMCAAARSSELLVVKKKLTSQNSRPGDFWQLLQRNCGANESPNTAVGMGGNVYCTLMSRDVLRSVLGASYLVKQAMECNFHNVSEWQRVRLSHFSRVWERELLHLPYSAELILYGFSQENLLRDSRLQEAQVMYLVCSSYHWRVRFIVALFHYVFTVQWVLTEYGFVW